MLELPECPCAVRGGELFVECSKGVFGDFKRFEIFKSPWNLSFSGAESKGKLLSSNG